MKLFIFLFLFLSSASLANQKFSKDIQFVGVWGDIIVVKNKDKTYAVKKLQKIGETNLSIIYIEQVAPLEYEVILSNGTHLQRYKPQQQVQPKQPLIKPTKSRYKRRPNMPKRSLADWQRLQNAKNAGVDVDGMTNEERNKFLERQRKQKEQVLEGSGAPSQNWLEE